MISTFGRKIHFLMCGSHPLVMEILGKMGSGVIKQLEGYGVTTYIHPHPYMLLHTPLKVKSV
jgi:long-subunit acyl-CoA synthetase (AMP-forming)